MVLRRLLVLCALVSCRPAQAPAEAPHVVLADTAGGQTAFPDDFAKAKATVVVFYADHCPCFHVHEARLAELDRAYREKGVRFLVVDSEIDATLPRDAASAAAAGLPAIALDPGAKLADAVGAQYATYTVVFDGEGRVRYRGGIDSDKNTLHDDAKPFVRDALDDLLAGRDPRLAEGKTLGCALMKK